MNIHVHVQCPSIISSLSLSSTLTPRSQEIRKERHSQRSKGGGGGGGDGGREGGGGGIDLPLEAPEPLPEPVEMEAFKVDEYKDLSKGSFDTGDPLTTNLYVGNINPKVLWHVCMSVIYTNMYMCNKCTCTCS